MARSKVDWTGSAKSDDTEDEVNPDRLCFAFRGDGDGDGVGERQSRIQLGDGVEDGDGGDGVVPRN